MQNRKIHGNMVDIDAQEIYPSELTLQDGIIADIRKLDTEQDLYIIPPFVDAHVHVESSLLTPAEFARAAIRHGTLASVSDPHEIANVCGMDGIRYMLENSKDVPFEFHFCAPSCVPASEFETSGASIKAEDIAKMHEMGINTLGEMMNWPGVVYGDPGVGRILTKARELGMRIDGHAPGLSGEELKKYISAGISTDHECSDINEAREKLELGMHILIREGSAAKNFDTLIPLALEYPDNCMLCSDDKHADELLKGHINELCARAVKAGLSPFDALRIAASNAVEFYGLNLGQLKKGQAADMLLVRDLQDFMPEKVYRRGNLLLAENEIKIPYRPPRVINNFFPNSFTVSDLKVPEKPRQKII